MRSVVLAALVLIGCGESVRPEADSGPPPDAGPSNEPPAPPVFGPCPPGWLLTDGDVPVCEPWSEASPAACTGAQGRFAGSDECVSPGTVCPTGDWQDELLPPGWVATPRRLYVRAGATGGVGSQAAPYGTINQALAAADSGTTILVSAGTYDEVLRLRDGVRVWGACPEETTVVSSEPREGTGIVNFVDGRAGLGNLRLGTSPRPGIIASGPDVTADVLGVAVTGAETAGVFVTREARLRALSLIVADTRSRPSDGWLGRGVDVYENGDVLIEHAVIRGNQDTGLSALDSGTRIELLDVVVRDTVGRSFDGLFGRGIIADAGASISGSEVVVLNNLGVGVGGIRRAVIALDQLLVRGTESDVMGHTGRGIAVLGADFRGSRVFIEDSRSAGLIALNPSEVNISHLVIRDVRGRALDGAFGRGIVATAGATIEADHVLIQNVREVGVTVDGGSTATLTDVVIEDTLASDCVPACLDLFGIGVSSFGVSALDLTRFRISRSALAGVQIGDPPPGPAAVVSLTDGEITDAPIGVNLQPTSYDFDSFATRVSIQRVDRVIDATFLPLPSVEL
ncbi:MAG: hypothetical protein DRJ42_10395 [Deltaproteobacteria bacterium]|nr:MAG: hypothetical protein DRJ42_10395 [Deltaproteobacteria bacterium]